MDTNPLADILKLQTTRAHRKLSFEEQCGWYIALRLEIAPAVVSEASGLSVPTMSYLRMAGQLRSGQVRYPLVAREFEALGEEAFTKKYLTPLIRERLMGAIAVVNARKRDPDLNPQGYNPRASRYLGRHDWPETSIGMHAVFRIELHPELKGYFWRNLKPFQLELEVPEDQVNSNPACVIRGDPDREAGRWGFATSEACYRAVKRRMNPTPAQLDQDE
jgi:hypothetical protein